MKKFIISSVVGAIIIFIWSALSWMILPVHTHSMRYTPKQDTIMKVLNSSSLEEGLYAMPSADNRNLGMIKDGKYLKEMDDMNKQNTGKPFAMLIYGINHGMCASQYIYGFIVDLLAVMCAVILLVMSKDKLKTFFMRWWAVMIIGFIVVLNSYMLEWNWMQFPWYFIKGEIIDTFMEWGLCGVWLAWYFRKA
jgi:hypothetical protein